MCWDSPANGVPSTARRARVFLRTRRYTPDLRAFARSSVMRPTSRPRYSATTIALAFATCAEISATTAFFLSRSRPKVYLHLSKPPVVKTCGTHGDLAFRKILHGVRHLRRTEGRFDIDFSFRLNVSVPTVFDNPPQAVRAVRWPKVLPPTPIGGLSPRKRDPVSISMLRRRAAAKAPHVHPHARSHGRRDRHLAEINSLLVGRFRFVDRVDQRHQVV